MKKPFNMFLVSLLILFLCPTFAFASSEIIAKRGMNEEYSRAGPGNVMGN